MTVLVSIAALLAAQNAEAFWPLQATAPGTNSRSNVWHSMFNVPPFEEARTLPLGVLGARTWVEGAWGDFREEDEGGRSTWEELLLEEHVQIDYGIWPRWQAGLRLTAGSMKEQRSHSIAAFHDGALVTEDLKTGFAASSAVLRAKYADVWSDGFDWGVLAEVKVPLDDKRSPMSAGTVDVAFSLQGTQLVADAVWVHVNVGFVAPLGDTGLFATDDDPNVFFTYALGAAYRMEPWLTLFLQGEGNSSAFRRFKEIDHSVAAFSVGARADVGGGFSLDVAGGRGIDEFSTNAFVSVGLNLALRPR